MEDLPKVITRRFFNGWAAAGIGAAALTALPFGARPAGASVIGPDGLMTEPWFLNSFLILSEDLEEAHQAGKRFAVIFSLEGCPYCREMHEVNFARKDITDFVRGNFNILQINIVGARLVTDFDGEELTEKKLAEKWGVRFTPTTVFFPTPDKLPKGASGRQAEVARMPGYMKPFHFMAMYQFVHEKAYLAGKFGPYVRDKIKVLKSAGKSPENW
ncbi:MAG: thioredoxin [Rhodospirillales bacterium CG15_BIG_FIL_POST_REV_8_21_14_020_66_15]|nr:MAG: thioredoxin [Rhodospirillales bacterium CG15_BIG_FIL_POST_REV_8_21_14_020_66_15]